MKRRRVGPRDETRSPGKGKGYKDEVSELSAEKII